MEPDDDVLRAGATPGTWHAPAVVESFARMLTGGHPNSLGRTAEVVAVVLADHSRLEELFATVADPDAVVRLRVGDALEKVCRERPEWFVEHVDRVLDELGEIPQPSIQWHVAQVLDRLHGDLSEDQAGRATTLLQRNLAHSTDWIVLNVTMDVLTRWAAHDPRLTEWLAPQLQRLREDTRRSVATRASRRQADLAG